MAAFNFSLNPRVPINPSLSNGNCVNPIGNISGTIVRPPPPQQTAPPTSGHLVTMHHPLMGSARPILFSHQGFPLAANQFFNDSIYSSSSLTPSLLPSALNDAPLEFNVLRPKSDMSEQTTITNAEKLPVPSINILQNQEKQIIINSTEAFNLNDKKSLEFSEASKELIDAESDDSCQAMSEMIATTERRSSAVSTPSNMSNQSVPVLTSNAGVWKNIVPNMNLPILNVNQMLASNLIDSSLFTGQTFGVFGPVLSQLPNTTPVASDSGSNASTKNVIHSKSCTLLPPNANAPPPTTRERPVGCKTVFVGGLPENIKEEVIREVFGFCGEITNIRLSNKKFCHIRFAEESAVDQALTLSGYRIRLGSSSDAPNTGRLHVDFAHARDDQYEWECKQRQIQREQRHRERLMRDSDRDVSPSAPSHFTESEANSVLEKLKGEDTFTKAISIAVSWLDRGECNKRNVNTFYSMIQSVNTHVRRLVHDKNLCESEFKKAKDLMKSRAQAILAQFCQIEKLFVSSSHKKVWDHFTKAQRKNIELWKKSAMEIKKLPAESEEPLNDEMDVSDSDDDDDAEKQPFKKRKIDIAETNSLKDENDSLRCQLEAYKNEICVIRTESQCELSKKDDQISLLQKTLNNFTQEMESIRKQHEEAICENIDRKMQEADTTVIPSSNIVSPLTEKEAKLIGLVSIFLHIHPFGAGVDYICSFLQKTMPSLRVTEIELVMSKFPSVFQQELVGIGANMERRWKYAGFKTNHDLITQL
ncbi:hypothetical protein V9T40_000684 [Parthenolecanium corni]|uniref:RRM domain-containing protein n=1 Tax=Parthenolecanium corni TaxID=536013 RepID=A0AAN9TC27_9HEMI